MKSLQFYSKKGSALRPLKSFFVLFCCFLVFIVFWGFLKPRCSRRDALGLLVIDTRVGARRALIGALVGAVAREEVLLAAQRQRLVLLCGGRLGRHLVLGALGATALLGARARLAVRGSRLSSSRSLRSRGRARGSLGSLLRLRRLATRLHLRLLLIREDALGLLRGRSRSGRLRVRGGRRGRLGRLLPGAPARLDSLGRPRGVVSLLALQRLAELLALCAQLLHHRGDEGGANRLGEVNPRVRLGVGRARLPLLLHLLCHHRRRLPAHAHHGDNLAQLSQLCLHRADALRDALDIHRGAHLVCVCGCVCLCVGTTLEYWG